MPLRVHLSLFQDETSRQCHWHLPEAHYLEAWSDTLAYDGTASIVQPLIEPLYQGRSAHEVLALLADAARDAPGYEIVRGYWRRHWQAAIGRATGDFERLLADGAARRRRGRHALRRREPFTWNDGLAAAPGAGAATGKHGRTRAMSWCSSPTRRSTTAVLPTTAGCRNCPSRSPSSPGTTPPS